MRAGPAARALGDALGALCAAALPVPDRLYLGDPGSDVAVCTLSSTGLLDELGRSPAMAGVRVAGRLLSENRGIDALVARACAEGIRCIIVCGADARGHRAGHSLLALWRNGAGPDGRIRGSASPDPYLGSPPDVIGRFRRGVALVDLVGETRLWRVAAEVSSRLAASRG